MSKTYEELYEEIIPLLDGTDSGQALTALMGVIVQTLSQCKPLMSKKDYNTIIEELVNNLREHKNLD